MNKQARHVLITPQDTNKEYNSKDDWGLYIQNYNCIGDPVQQLNYIQIPGSDRQVDASEALIGRPIYTSRPITIQLAGKSGKNNWDSITSAIRNAVEGRNCKITFSNDPQYYWYGRVHITEVDSLLGIGTITLSIPEAEPYKYSHTQSIDPWIWDTFPFETGIITNLGYITVNGTRTVVIPRGYMEVSPTFNVKAGGNITVSNGIVSRKLPQGNTRDPRITVNGIKEVTLTFTGQGEVGVIYREGSL